MRLSFEVDGQQVTFRRDPWLGRATLSVGGEVRVLDRVLDPATQLGIQTTRVRSAGVLGHEVVVTKIRSRLFGGLRRQSYSITVDGSVVAEGTGY